MEFASLISVNIRNIIFNILNFLILVLIIKHFFYDKINNFIKKRSDDVASEIQNAESLKTEAEKYKEEYLGKLSQAEVHSREIIEEAMQRGKERKKEILEEARLEVLKVQDRARNEIDLEKKKAADEVKGNVVDLTIYATEKLIKETLDKEKQEKLILDFIEQVGEVE